MHDSINSKEDDVKKDKEINFLPLDTTELLENNYILNEPLIHNENEFYEIWNANSIIDKKKYFIKFFFKKENNIFDLLRYKDKYPIPKKECTQLNYLNTMKNEKVKFEKCINVYENEEKSLSEIPYYNIFEIPEGESLNELCFERNCRSKLKKIIRYLFSALKLTTNGPKYSYSINNFSPNNIYFFEDQNNSFVSITNIKINSNLETSSKNNEIFRKDLKLIGLFILKILSQEKEFEPVNNRLSALYLYLDIHKLNNYSYDDSDLNVPKNFNTYTAKEYTYKEKEEMLSASIYNLIYRCISEDNYFLNSDEALNHKFLEKTNF